MNMTHDVLRGIYICDNGSYIIREKEFGFHWVYRDENFKLIDHSKYRHDLFCRYNLKEKKNDN